jgi:HPt (histidine-containing phosphotransfer) domain-containing protein
MNLERAIEEFEGDKDFLMEVLNGFLDNVRTQLGTIRQAISDGDSEAVRRETHSIKGGAANLTADKLSSIAFELENIGKSGVLEGGIEALERLEKEFYRLEGYVRNLAI